MHSDASVTAKSLRIGFDYWPAASHAPGVGRYLRELVRALAALEQAPELALLDVGPAGDLLLEGALGLESARSGLLRRRWRARRGWLNAGEQFLGLRAETWLGKLDVFQRALPYGAPTARAPTLLALAEFPERSSARESELRRTLRSMAALLVFSEAARSEAQARFALDPARVHCVPVGADHWRRDLGTRPMARERARILVLGAVRSGRGHAEILCAFEQLRARGLDADLVFCGRRADQATRLESSLRSSPVRLDVRWIDEPVEREMPILVSSASVLVHLADEEWTAVTPLEAFALGVAVVASPCPAFEEALGGLATFVQRCAGTDQVMLLTRALENCLTNDMGPAACQKRVEHARRFTWQENARATLEVYRHIAQ